MIPAEFKYAAPKTIPEALTLLRTNKDAKLVSGGHSIIPLMKLRLAAPPFLIDLNRIADLDYIREEAGWLRIGALVRESDLEDSDLIRAKYHLLHDTSHAVADPLVRNRVTLAGNIAHADPANPMIVDGQIHGGLTMGMAPALMEEIVYDENGVNLAGTFSDYLLPTAVETPNWETGKTVTPSPHHPLGAKGVGESATVGAPPAIANAVVDALWHLGVRNIDIPITPPKVWQVLKEKGVAL